MRFHEIDLAALMTSVLVASVKQRADKGLIIWDKRSGFYHFEYGGIGRHLWMFWNNMFPYVMRRLVEDISPKVEDGKWP